MTTGGDSSTQEVAFRIYLPSSPHNAKLPIGVWFHGGGWISGTLDCEDNQCCFIAKETPCIVVSVDYKLAPEYKTPQILASCAQGVRYVSGEIVHEIEASSGVGMQAYANAAELGGDRDKLFTIGGSAGAALALNFAPSYVGRSIIDAPVRGCIAMNPTMVYPELPPSQYEHLYRSYKEFELSAVLIRGQTFRSAYVWSSVIDSVASEPGDKSIVNFTYDTTLHGQFPPTCIATCEKDLMRDEGVILESMLRDAGVPVKRDHYMGLPHYFFIFPSLDKTQIFLKNVAAGIRFVVGDGGDAVTRTW